MNGHSSKRSSDEVVVSKRQPPLQNNGYHHDHNANVRQSSDHTSFSGGDLVTIVRDNINHTHQKIISEFDQIDELLIDRMTIHAFSDYITRERLGSMPHRGSLWDRVLRWAEFYALQVASYSERIGPFVPESRTALKHILVLLRSLLEHGEENAAALNTTFGVFYKLGLSLAFLNAYESKLSLNSHIRDDVGRAFQDIHSLVFDVASYYRRTIRDLSNGSVTIDLTGVFRESLDRFHNRKLSIINHMWRHALGGENAKDVPKVRKWLDQRYSILKAISPNSYEYESQYDEYTCEWFQKHLLSFNRSSDKVLAITAPAGCGKTRLSSWIQERLQRPMDGKTCSTLVFSFDADIPSECTSLALVKGLSLQLMNLRVGNTAMFELINKAYGQKDAAEIENLLWDAIDAGIAKSPEPITIIIDALDEIKGGNIKPISERITTLALKHTALKSIILSKPVAGISASNNKWKLLEIKADDVYDDLRHISKHALQSCEQFRIQTEAQQQAVIEHLVKTANGSFLWLLLTIRVLESTTSAEAFGKAVKDAAKTLDGVIQKQFDTIDFANTDVKLVLSILLVTERPLTLSEIYEILQVDVQRKTNTKRHIEMADTISKTQGLLKINETEVVTFGHNAIRTHLLGIQNEGKRLLGPKDTQAELTMRLLIYMKASLTVKRSVTLEQLAYSEAEHMFTKHRLLEYAVRNWILHFRDTGLYKATGSFEFSPDFKSLFPSSTLLVLLEWTCWDGHGNKQDIPDMHFVSLRIRAEVFGEHHECTLQKVITSGFIHTEFSPASITAKYFFRASRISQAVLGKFHKITIACTSTFLTITESIKVTTRTEIVTWREEMLKFIITAYKHEHGETSDIVLRYYKILAELYVTIHEDENATVTWKELRLLIVKKHGEGSTQDREITGKLMIVLNGKKDVEVKPYYGDVFVVDRKKETVWDEARITMMLQLALACEQRKEICEAEEIYVTLWSRVLQLCKDSHVNDINLRIRVLRIAVEYVNFLRRCNRHEEAKNVLVIVWTEYQHFGCESLEFYLQLKSIGQLMRSFGLFTLAVSVFEKVSQWFKAVGKHDHEEFYLCERYLLEVIEEVTSKETIHKEETTEEIETIIRRTFSSTTVVTKEYITTTRVAVQLYTKREQWSEAISVLTKSLALLWTESSWGADICLPAQYADEAIEFAIELGRCHMKCKNYHQSLSCYLQLWEAVRSSSKFNDARSKLVVDLLIKFYTEHRRWRSLIELHKELLIEHRRHLGNAHPDTISILYLIADLVLEHGHGNAEDYYREIIEVIGKTDTKRSFTAYKVLCQIYYDDSRWLQLKDVCDVLWKLLIHHHKEYEFNADFVELLYIRYTYVLRHHHKYDHKALVAIAAQYQEICTLKFGSSSSIYVSAKTEYASVLIQDKSTVSQAISIFEEIVTISKKSKTSVSESSLTTIKRHLTEAYVHVYESGSASTETLQRAVQVLYERFEHLKITLGVAHKETLSVLTQLVLMRFKLKIADFEQTTTVQLQQVVLEIISKEKRSQVLFDAASTIASIYVTCGLTRHGIQLMHEIRRQLVGAHSHGNAGTFKIEKSVGRISFVFLVAFELTLKGTVTSNYSEIMADWLTESVLYESYTQCFKTKTKIEVLLTRGAILRGFWESHGRHEEVLELEQSITDVFYKQFSAIIKTKIETARIFVVAILIHLSTFDDYNSPLSKVSSLAGNAKVLSLLKSGDYQKAHALAHCTFHFVVSQNGYHNASLIGYGFELAGYMVSHGATKIPAELRLQMLQTSREIMGRVLQTCKEANIQFSRLHDHELNSLIALLAEQENYKELELILESLWKSRHEQKHWSEDTLINLGIYLIASRHLANSKDGSPLYAIHLAEDINYNLRRVLGGLHPHTLEVSCLLSQLYTDAKKYSDAIGVHEEILQLIVSGDDGDDSTIDVVSPATAKLHLDLLKAAYLRNGKWVKSASTYENLVDSLLSMSQFKTAPEFKNAQRVQAWKRDEAVPPSLGAFVKPVHWELILPHDRRPVEGHVHADESNVVDGAKDPLPAARKERPVGWNFRRISKNWGMSFGGGDEKPKLVY